MAERHWILSLKEKGLRRRLCSLVSFHPPVRNRIKANPWRGRNSAPCFFYHKGVGGPPYPHETKKIFFWVGMVSAPHFTTLFRKTLKSILSSWTYSHATNKSLDPQKRTMDTRTKKTKGNWSQKRPRLVKDVLARAESDSGWNWERNRTAKAWPNQTLGIVFSPTWNSHLPFKPLETSRLLQRCLASLGQFQPSVARREWNFATWSGAYAPNATLWRDVIRSQTCRLPLSDGSNRFPILFGKRLWFWQLAWRSRAVSFAGMIVATCRVSSIWKRLPTSPRGCRTLSFGCQRGNTVSLPSFLNVTGVFLKTLPFACLPSWSKASPQPQSPSVLAWQLPEFPRKDSAALPQLKAENVWRVALVGIKASRT